MRTLFLILWLLLPVAALSQQAYVHNNYDTKTTAQVDTYVQTNLGASQLALTNTANQFNGAFTGNGAGLTGVPIAIPITPTNTQNQILLSTNKSGIAAGVQMIDQFGHDANTNMLQLISTTTNTSGNTVNPYVYIPKLVVGNNKATMVPLALFASCPVNQYGSASGGGGTNNQEQDQYQMQAAFTANSIQVGFANYGIGSFGSGASTVFTYEYGGASPINVHASVMYPTNVIYPVYKNGNRIITINSKGTMLFDPLYITIPSGSNYWIREWVDCTNGGSWNSSVSGFYPQYSSSAAQWHEQGSNNLTDHIDSGQVGGFSFPGYGPDVVLGHPANYLKSVFGVGDSIMWGQNSSLGYATSASWAIAAFQSNGVPFTEIAFPSSKVTCDFIQTNATSKFSATFPYASSAVIYIGINDIGLAGQTIANMTNSLMTLVNAIKGSGIQPWVCTIGPKTTSTDSWATTANQTTSTGESIRVAYNSFILGQNGISFSVIDMASAMCAPLDTSKWNTNGVAGFMTNDGTHPSTTGMPAMASKLSQAIPLMQ